MGLDILLLDFYGLTLIHLTGPLSQVVQTVYVWYVIYIYELFFIYIYIRGKKRQVVVLFCFVFSWGWEEHVLHELFRAHTPTVLDVEREEPIELGVSLHHELIVTLNTRRAQEWLSMGSIKVNFS